MSFSLHHTFVTGQGTPRAWLMFLHGIYGSGGNWRTAARKVIAERGEYGAVLVDLRMHGRSQNAPPPHSVAAAADDVARLVDELAGHGKRVAALSGHSFGGKVALGVRGLAPKGLKQIWVLDSSPSLRPDAMDDPNNTVRGVLDMLTSFPAVMSGRDEFVTRVVEHGFAAPLGHWLAMNLERDGDTFRLGLDLAVMRTLLQSYYDADMWPAVENRGSDVDLHVIASGASDSVPIEDRHYLSEIAFADPQVSFDVIEGASHWLHIDALNALVERVVRHLPRIGE